MEKLSKSEKRAVGLQHKTDSDQDFQKRQTEYKNVLNELIHTEKSLVSDMDAIYKGYFEVIKKAKNTQSLEICFKSIEGIINIGSVMVEKIESSQKTPLDIAHIFDEFTTDIKYQYGEYCSKYPSSTVELEALRLDVEINEQLKKIQASLTHLLPLESYMLKPIQRIMKYPLLLKSMLKLNLLDEDGQIVLGNTQKNLIKVSEYINEKKREMEGISLVEHYNNAIVNLQEHFTVDSVGPVQLEHEFNKGLKKIKAILFSKRLVLTKPLSDGKFSFYKQILIKDIILLDNSSKSATAFEISSYEKPKKKIIFEAKQPEIKEQWITHIKALILENLSLNLNDTKLSALLGERMGSQVSTILSVKEDVALSRSTCEMLNTVFINNNEDASSNDINVDAFSDGIPTSTVNQSDPEPEFKRTLAKRVRPRRRPPSPPRKSLIERDKELLEKASTAMNLLETISSYNAEYQQDETKRKMYESVPWSRKLIRNAMIETDHILNEDSDDVKLSRAASNESMNLSSPILRKSIVSRKKNVTKKPSQSRTEEPIQISLQNRKSIKSETDDIFESKRPSSAERKHGVAINLANRYESIEQETQKYTSQEKTPIVVESLASRVQKLFEKTQSQDIVVTKQQKVTPKKASLIGQRLMQLQEKVMTDISIIGSLEKDG